MPNVLQGCEWVPVVYAWLRLKFNISKSWFSIPTEVEGESLFTLISQY